MVLNMSLSQRLGYGMLRPLIWRASAPLLLS
jgi:hypothetical protein